ncbi:MAG: hypothetical protein HY204_12500 [Nitrospirae bacterium]|nr:hypothetical protein [Nitrospirota bacterium]
MNTKKLIELRKQAEKAVADMTDGEFKLKAFEVILNHLLAPGKAEAVAPTSSEAKSKIETSKGDRSEIETESISGRILVLKDEGYFKSPKYIGEIRAELQAHGCPVFS